MSATSEQPVGTAGAAPARRSRPWLRAAIVVGALLFLALLTYGVLSDAPEGTIEDRLEEGEVAPAPGFDLPILEQGQPGPELAGSLAAATSDGALSLDELRGRPVVVNFWASWCEPCRAEAAALEQGWQRARRRGVVFVGLNMQDLTGDARKFTSELGSTYPHVRDESNGAALDWGVTGLPETFFVSRGGGVVAHAIGAVSPEQLERGVRAAEEGRPLGSIQGGDRRSVE